MRFRVVSDEGTVQRIQVARRDAWSRARCGAPYRTGLPGSPRDRVVTHTTRYGCSCGQSWSTGRHPKAADLDDHS